MAKQTVEVDSDTGRGMGRSEPLRLIGTVLLIALWVADLAVHQTTVHKVLGFVLVPVLVRVTISDLEERRIRNLVTLPAAILALLIGLVLHPSGVPSQLLYGVAAGAFFMLFVVISSGGLGMGDAKLALVLGLFLSRWVVDAIAIGLVAASLFGVGVMMVRGFKAGRRTGIPLAPFLALGGVVALLAGPTLHLAT